MIKNGYLIIQDHADLFDNGHVFKGATERSVWPLHDFNNSNAIKLTKEADEKWFSFKNCYLEIIPDVNYIKRYIVECDNLNIKVSVFNVKIIDSNTDEVDECFGYDCLGNIYYSYLYEDNIIGNIKYQGITKEIMLNDNGLFANYNDALKYKKIREQLIQNGINLEDYWTPLIVKFEKIDI